MEERSEFRPQTVAATSRLSIAEKRPFHLASLSSRMVRRVLEMLGSREVSVNEIGPVCLWAPSHPFHVMPPRITRNSCRPRASDRTMVDLESPFASRSRKLDSAANSPEEPMGMGTSQTSSERPNHRGLDLETTSPLRSRQKFFLDIPFDRTH